MKVKDEKSVGFFSPPTVCDMFVHTENNSNDQVKYYIKNLPAPVGTSKDVSWKSS